MDESPGTQPDATPPKVVLPPPVPESVLLRPIALGSLDSTIDFGKFFSVSGGSILYCLSAMCVVYGFMSVLGPVFVRSHVFGDTLPCIIGLNVYELALLAVLVLIVARHAVTDDAISLVVLVAVFLIVSGIALTTTANSWPRMVQFIGIGCFVLAMGKLFVLRRFIGMRISPWLWLALAVVLGWNFLAGGYLANATSAKTMGRELWMVSWLALLAGALVALLDATLRKPEAADESRPVVPFLRRPAMGWILTLVVFVAALVHQRALAYVFDVQSAFIDYLPLVCVLSLFLLRIAMHLRSERSYLDTVLAAVPLGVFFLALTGNPTLQGPVLGFQILWYPPLFIGLTGLAILLMGIDKRSPYLLTVVPFYALVMALTMAFSDTISADLHWRLAGALLVSGLLLAGLVLRNVGLCVAAVLVGTVGLASSDAFDVFVRSFNIPSLTPGLAALGLAGVATLGVALALGKMHSALLVAASLAVSLCVFAFLPSKLGASDLIVLPAMVLLAVGLFLRRRHWPSIVILCVPLGYRLAVGSVLLGSWRYVVLGFALLVAGAWVSIRKGKRARSESE